MANKHTIRLAGKVFHSANPNRTALCTFVTAIAAFIVSHMAVRTFCAAIAMTLGSNAYADFGDVMLDPLGGGTLQFFAASGFGALGGAVSYVRTQNAERWESSGLRAFVGHMVVAQFAAVMAFLAAGAAKWDGYWVLIAVGAAGYMGDKALDKVEPIFEALVSVLTSKKSP